MCVRPSQDGSLRAGNNLYSPLAGGMKKPHTCSVLVNVGEKATFDVTYQPKEAVRTQATVQLSVEDNQYEDSVIQVCSSHPFFYSCMLLTTSRFLCNIFSCNSLEG